MQKEQPEVYGQAYSEFDIFMSHDWPKGKQKIIYRYRFIW